MESAVAVAAAGRLAASVRVVVSVSGTADEVSRVDLARVLIPTARPERHVNCDGSRYSLMGSSKAGRAALPLLASMYREQGWRR